MTSNAWRPLIFLGAWAIYLLAFPALYTILGANVAALVLVPVAVTAWLGGLVWGVLAGGLAFLSNTLLLSQMSLQPAGWSMLFDLGGGQLSMFSAFIGLLLGSVQEMRQRLRRHEEMSQVARQDALTGLPNRSGFEIRLEQLLRQQEQGLVAILMLDLDHFKDINDMYGHHVGDELLWEVATRLKEGVRKDDLVARLGGDEFGVAVGELESPRQVARLAESLVQSFSAPFVIAGTAVKMHCSVGISIYPGDGEDAATLLKHADRAMYRVNQTQIGSYQFSTMEVQVLKTKRLHVETQLRVALQQDEFELRFQPQVDLGSGKIVGVETLLRWNSPELGAVSPSEFIPIAERADLIREIGAWVLWQACKQGRRWHEEGYPPIKIAVNASTAQFLDGDFADIVERALKETGFNPRQLEIEITETLLMRQLDTAILALNKLQKLGVRTSIDDFGSGYSSLAYLQRLPIGTLKIDKSFVSAIRGESSRESNSAHTIIEAICSLAHNLDKTVVGEGIETESQLAFLRSVGCDYAQGYYFSHPLRAAELEPMLIRHPQQDLSPQRAVEVN